MEYTPVEATPASSAAPVVSSPPPTNSASTSTGTGNSSNNNKILSRNSNGTLVLTSAPNNEAELQLYRVMQRASLLAYYDTLLEMGGDDVQQLCDAGEEEFLEIMALVGMASKPLHVRRLQKALQEWLSNPALFQTPLVPGGFSHRVLTTPVLPCVGGPSSPNHSSPSPTVPSKDNIPIRIPLSPSPNNSQVLTSDVASASGSPGRGPSTSTSPGPSPGSPLQLTPVLVPNQIARLAEAAHRLVRSLPHLEPKANNAKKKMCKDLEHILTMAEDDPRRMDQIRKYAAIYGRFDCKRKPEKPLTLHEVSVNEAAAQICRLVPALLTRRDELFPLARQVVRDSGYHYSKGHSKSYTVSHSARTILNYNGDQASQCKKPRLDGLHSLSEADESNLRLRRQERLEQITEELRNVSERTEELLGAAVQSYREPSDLPTLQYQMEALQSRQTQLLLEQSEIMKHNHLHSSRRSSSSGRMSSCLDAERLDTDDTDSQLSFSNASSPSQEVGDSRDSLTRDTDTRSPSKPGSQKQSREYTAFQDSDEELRLVKEMVVVPAKSEPSDSLEDSFYQENKVHVIASSGGNIIAVANPALSMSPAITEPISMKKETLSPLDRKSVV